MSGLDGSDPSAKSVSSDNNASETAEPQISFRAGPESWLLRHSTGDGADHPHSQLGSSSQPPGPWRSPTLVARRHRQSASMLTKPLAFAKLLQSGILTPYLTTERQGEGVNLDSLQNQLPPSLARTNFSFTVRKSTDPVSTEVRCNLFWDMPGDTHGPYKVVPKAEKQKAMERSWRSHAALEANDTAQPLLSVDAVPDTATLDVTGPELHGQQPDEGDTRAAGAHNPDAMHSARGSSAGDIPKFTSQPIPDTDFFHDNRSPLPGSNAEDNDDAGNNMLDFDEASGSATPAWCGRLPRGTCIFRASNREAKILSISLMAGDFTYLEHKQFSSGSITAMGDKPSETPEAGDALIFNPDLDFDTLCARIIPNTPQ